MARKRTSRKRTSRRRTSRRYHGGESAAENAQKVFGGMEQQHAAQGQGNLIAMSSQSGGKQQQQQQAGNVLMDIAVPAVLVTANHLYKGKQLPVNFVSSRKFRNSRKSRRFRRR